MSNRLLREPFEERQRSALVQGASSLNDRERVIAGGIRLDGTAGCVMAWRYVMATFIDTHAHLDFPEFAPDLPAVLERAKAAEIERVMSIGTDLESSQRAIDLAEEFPAVYAAAGWHPGEAEEAPTDFRSELRRLAAHPKVVAIGECGLDFFRLPTRMGTGTEADDQRIRDKQAVVFQQQLEVAAELGLNVVIHTRDSFAETLEQFRPFAEKVRAVFHCFVGTVAEMEAVLALGSLVSFTGITTFKSALQVRETLAATPLDGFMLETDSPFLAPVPHRGQRCEPAFVKDLAVVVAGAKACSLETLSAATQNTARRFFTKLK